MPAALALSVAVLAFLCYRHIFGYFFTAGDALTQIETSRVSSLKDIVRILSEPMMNGTKLLQIIQMYRPTAIFSYSIDYALWGLNATGYHVTDVSLHAAVSVLTFFLLRRLTRSDLAAWIGAVLFAVHPVHVENVPAIARRHDAVALLFLLPSFLLFLKNHESAKPSRTVSVLSLVMFALALGAKEISTILPVLLVVYLGLQELPVARSRAAFRRWLANSIRPAIPYFALTFIYVAWRTWVLHGLGGEVAERYKSSGIPGMYVRGLLDPYGFAGGWTTTPVIVAASVLVLFWVYWRFVRRIPGVAPPDTDRTTKPLVLLLAWLMLPLAILMITGSFHIRRIYVAVIPVTGILAILIVDAFRVVRAGIASAHRSRSMTVGVVSGTAVFALAAFVCAGFVWYSPLVKPYGQWREVSTLSRDFLDALSEAVPTFPKDAIIHVHDLPWRILQSSHTRPAVQTPASLLDYSIKSWIDLNFSDNDMDVILDERPNIELLPEKLWLETRKGHGKNVEVRVRVEFSDVVESPEDQRNLGKSYMDIGEFDLAIEHLEKYVKDAPDGHLGWALLGQAYRETGDVEAAEKFLRRSLAINDTDNATAYFSLSKLLRDERRFTEARTVCHRWVQRMPGERADAYRNLAWCYAAKKSYRQAIEYFRKSLDAQQNIHTYWGLTLAYIDGIHDYQNGQKYAREWVRFDNRNANGYLMLGLAQYQSGEIKRAIPNLEKSLEFRQRRPVARYRAYQTLAEAKLRLGDSEGGAEICESAAVAFPDSAGVFASGARSYARLGRCGVARKWLRNAVEKGLDRTEEAGVLADIRQCERKHERH